MRELHIITGLLALIAGGIALFATKGAPLHRRAGTVFVVAMLVMTTSAELMALFIKPNRVNVVAAALTFYLVCTAWLTVRRPVAESEGLLKGFLVLALFAGGYALTLGFEALAAPNGIVDKVPAPPIFMFATVGLLAAALDARLLIKGHIEGPQRLARHLWRMTFALWIATMSFFLGQAKLFPAPLRKIHLLAIPVLVVMVLLFYWLARVLFKKGRSTPANAVPSA